MKPPARAPMKNSQNTFELGKGVTKCKLSVKPEAILNVSSSCKDCRKKKSKWKYKTVTNLERYFFLWSKLKNDLELEEEEEDWDLIK